MTQSHIDETIFIDIFSSLQEKYCVRGIKLLFVEILHKFEIGLELASDEISELDMELCGSALEEEGTFELISVELGDLLFVDP